MYKTIWCVVLLLGSGCEFRSHFCHQVSYEKYKDDLVSVSTALSLGHNSYVLACTQAKNSPGYFNCNKQARKHIKENVEFILNQTPAVKTEVKKKLEN